MAAVVLSPPIIIAVSDRTRLGASDDDAAFARLVRWAGAVAAAGVDLIQVRERGLTDRQLGALVREVVGAARSTAAQVVVNERADVALTCDAAGVHLPSTAPPCRRIRSLVPEGFLIGRSVHASDLTTGSEGDEACNYVLFGTVFASASKGEGHAVTGVAALADACESLTRPVLAIGGVNVATAEEAGRAGAAGIAAIGLFVDPMRRPDHDIERSMTDLVGNVRQAFERGARARWTQATDRR
jgi:thiamine-phosphate pyrophosphorylase